MSDVDALSAEQRILRAWAQAKLGHLPRLRDGLVARVEIQEFIDDGWSEYTPGEGWYATVTAFGHNGNGLKTWKYTDGRELVIDVCRFAGNLMQAPREEGQP